MKVLVTGGAGFIGSHTVDLLVSRGYEVSVLDDLSSGSLENILDHIRRGRISMVRGDVRDYRVVEESVKGVNAIIHQAAIVSVDYSIGHPVETFEVNTLGTLNLLEAARRWDVDRFVYASSCAVYGDPEVLPIPETHPVKPKNPYAASKAAGEAYVRAYADIYGLDAVILRYFNVYGPRQRPSDYSGVISRFISRVKSGEPPVIYGDGHQTRDFVFVVDVAECNLKALECRGLRGEVFNVGTGVETSIKELAEIIMELARFKGEPVHSHERPGDIRRSVADVTKLSSMLGYRPSTDLREGLRKTLESMDEGGS